MSYRKYLQPEKYWSKAILLVAKLLLKLGITLERTSVVNGVRLTFIVTSFLEFFLRAREDFVRHPSTVKWIFDVIEIDDVVYDIGANVGGFACLIGKRMQEGKGSVYAFEPAASNFFSLVRNIGRNDLTTKINAYPLAFSDRPRIGTLHCSSLIPGASVHSIQQRGSSASLKHKVIIETLNEFIDRPSIRFPNHLKIDVDVDGAEAEIIRGMSRLLLDSRLKTVMIEVDGDEAVSNISEIFRQSGFQEYARDLKPRAGLCDILFVRER